MLTRSSSLRYAARAAAACLCIAGLSACGSGHRSQTPQERAESVPRQIDELATLGYRIQWRGFPSMGAGATVQRLTPLGDVVAVQDSEGTLSVLDDTSGSRRWSDQPANPLTRYVGVLRKDNQVILSSESDVYFFDVQTGNIERKQSLALVVNTKPALVGDVLVYGASNGQILGHLTLNGFQLWGSSVTGSVDADPVPVGGGGVLGVVSARGDVLFLDGATGRGHGRARMFRGSDAPLAASETLLFVASLDHSLYAFSREGGLQVWRYRTEAPLRNAPAYHDGRVYADLGREGLTAFEAATGKVLWHSTDVHGRVVGLRDNRLLVWDGATATLVNPANGSVVERVRLSQVSRIETDAFADGDLYLASPNGVVTKLNPR